MEIWQSIILGIVEGITEFLPVSSTGHLILAGDLIGVAEGAFTKSFDIIIQLGAIAAVIVLYWKKLWNVETLKKLVVAFVPTAIIGLALYGVVKTYLIGNTAVVLWPLLIGGVVLIVFEVWYGKKAVVAQQVDAGVIEVRPISYKQAFIIGLAQSVAIIPGVSRSAATIVGGLMLGLQRTTIVEFSFLLAVPTIGAASAFDVLKNYESFSADQFGVLAVGFIVSFFVAYASIKFLLGYIKKHTFIPFGVYRIVAAILFYFLML